MSHPFLVTGAAGGAQGSTGRRVARLLLEQGIPVRALVHKLDSRSDELRTQGAEVVEGDLLNPASVQAAMRDVKRAYFTYPVADGLLEAVAIFGVLPASLRELRLTDSGFLPAAPLVSLAAAAGAGGIAAWGVCGDPLLVGSRFIRFAAKSGLPMIFRVFIGDVLGSTIFKQPSNQYQGRFVRIGELPVHQ